MSRCILTQNQIKKIYKTLEKMPKTYELDGVNPKPVGLKLFCHNMTAYIVEADSNGGEHLQAFGYVRNDSCPEMSEWGYINVAELINAGFEQDLYFENKVIYAQGVIGG